MAENGLENKLNFDLIKPVSIEKELKESFLDYAMSVIVSRALPDVRDGLKPVHRRILYAMHTLGLYKERAYKKSASVVGEVMAKYHPHGDSAIYQTMVGLVQNFSKRYPILDGQGNWGSIDGDNAAAMRYTEVKMEKIARDILTDIEKETVDFVPNYDESVTEPVVLPSRLPQLLLNGSNGIAVGMATSIPPHNLGEVVNACIEIIKNPNLTEDELFQIIPAPDFPGGAVITGLSGVRKAYRTGHGSVKVRGVVDIEESKGREFLVIKEIPYQVNKADLITKIADLAKNKVIDGITNIRDESARDKIRVVIDIRKGEVAKVILNQIYKHTQLSSSISMIMLAILDNKPTIFSLREMIDQFIIHRREIITRRCQFELRKNKKREHILIGLTTALENIDAVVKTIKKSQNTEDANKNLQENFSLSFEQSKAILEMRLHKLTSLEGVKIKEEIEEIIKAIMFLESILESRPLLDQEVIKELEVIKENYTDKRRTRIEADEENLTDIDLIPNDDVIVTLTKKGYIKRVKIENYSVQHRGGKGKKGTADLSEHEDLIQDVFVAKNHDDLLYFTNKGRVYTSKTFQVPEASRIARGRAIVNMLPLGDGEKILKLLKASNLKDKFLVMVTKNGVIKKTTAESFSKVRCTGIIAIDLREGDELSFCALSSGSDTIVLATSSGQGIRFKEEEVRPMGRQAAGVRGIKIKDNGFVVGLEIISQDSTILFATSNGYGKQVRASDFRIAHRGGLGVKTIPVDKRNGNVIGMVKICENSSILLIDAGGKIIRLNPDEIRTMRRGAKGVRLIRLDKTQRLVSVVSFVEEDPSTDSDEPSSSNSGSTPGAGEPSQEEFSASAVGESSLEASEKISSQPAVLASEEQASEKSSSEENLEEIKFEPGDSDSFQS